MSHPVYPDSEDDDVYETITMKPKPRAAFELSSPPPSEPSTPSNGYLQAPSSNMDGDTTPSRTKSLLNLTTSTLFGIYQQTSLSSPDNEHNTQTPWGTGAQTPAHSRGQSLDLSKADNALSNGGAANKTRTSQRSHAAPVVHRVPRRGLKGYYLPLAARLVALAGIGVLYGLLITQLHDRQDIAPTRVEIDRSSRSYLTWWAFAGVALGEAMPWVDAFWAFDMADNENEKERNRDGRRMNKAMNSWIDVVRSIGAFVGIAYAIRKLPWQSTLQLSLTLALANPAIWFIVDRSPPGFVLSMCFSLAGTLVLLGMNPALLPSPSPAEVLRAHVMRNGGMKRFANTSLTSEELVLGVFTQDSVGVATWIASVLFVSSVCFGNIGRWLAPRGP